MTHFLDYKLLIGERILLRGSGGDVSNAGSFPPLPIVADIGKHCY